MTHEPRTEFISRLRLVAHGPVEDGALSRIGAALSRRVPVPCVTARRPLVIDTPWIPGRNQVDADAMLRLVEAHAGEADERWVCLTGNDIGSRVFAYFFGRARLDGCAVLVSLVRLDPTFCGFRPDVDLVVARAVKEILHELGHISGLRHCDDQDCLMHFSADVASIDRRGHDYCEECGEVASGRMRLDDAPA